jgi:hypothetical protein
MVFVRTYWFPGSFNEANPESSARYIETIELHVEADSPPLLSPTSLASGTHPDHPLGTIPNWRTVPAAAGWTT